MNSRTWSVCLPALLVVLAGCSGNKDEPGGAAQDAASAGTTIANVAQSPEDARKDITRSIDKLVAAYSRLPRTDFDPGILSASLGADPHRHFEWVRDRTSWAPYRGLLRGAQGVMLDRVGSSLDRSVLLGDLLHRAGHKVRLARATLSEARARELLGTIRPIPAPAPRAEADEQMAEAQALVRSQTDAILAAVKTAVSPVPGDESAAVAALRDHWWVEREEGGKWIAMDVLLPDAKPGDSIVAAASTSVWDQATGTPRVSADDWHRVEMKVVIERYEAGATEELTALEATLRPAELVGQPVRLRHAPVPWPEQLVDIAANPQTFRDVALSARIWIPVLQTGGEPVIQSGFTDRGELISKLTESVDDIAKVGGADVVSGMDMALGGFGAEEAAPSVTAEWIDYVIKVPGARDRKLRRPVFDLLGPSRRASRAADFDGTADLRKLERFEALWSPTDIMLQCSDLTPEFVAYLHASDLVSNQEALKKLAREEDSANAQSMAGELLERIELWGALPNYVLWRSGLGEQSESSFVDQPNVLHYRAGRRLVNATQNDYRELIDVALNPRSPRRGVSSGSFEVRVGQGVADTVAEMLALGADLGSAENTASVFGRLAAQDSRGMVIAAGDETTARALPWPEDEIARVTADVAAGYVVVVPRQAVMIEDQQRVGWWRVDPMSGETIGVMDNGFHAGTVEYNLKLLVGTLAPFVLRPGNAERADAARRIVSQGGGQMLTAGQRHLLAVFDLYRLLLADLEVLSRSGRL